MLWRQKGAIGKLYNIVRFIYSSPQCSQRFHEIAQEEEQAGQQYEVQTVFLIYRETTAELDLVMDNNTR